MNCASKSNSERPDSARFPFETLAIRFLGVSLFTQVQLENRLHLLEASTEWLEHFGCPNAAQ